jgi:hypothetical protein
VIRHNDLGAAAELVKTLLDGLGAFDFDVDGLRAGADGLIEHCHLVLDAAIELSMILMPAARGQDEGVGELVEKLANGRSALQGLIEKVEAELKERLARLNLAPGVS